MPNKINLYPFNIVTVAFSVLVVLFAEGVVWGQADNPRSGGSITFPTRISVSHPFPQPPTYQNIAVTVPCKIWDADPNRTTWNGVNTTKEDPATGKTVRLENAETSNLGFSLNASMYEIHAADVDRFFDMAYHSAGYVSSDPAIPSSFAMNCHGYSTGKNCWLQDVNILLAYDYTPETIAKYLAEVGQPNRGVVLKTGDHSVLAYTTARMVNGEAEYKIVTTREKFLVSPIYVKEINQTYSATDNIAVAITTSFVNWAHVSDTVGYYWYPKR